MTEGTSDQAAGEIIVDFDRLSATGASKLYRHANLRRTGINSCRAGASMVAIRPADAKWIAATVCLPACGYWKRGGRFCNAASYDSLKSGWHMASAWASVSA